MATATLRPHCAPVTALHALSDEALLLSEAADGGLALLRRCAHSETRFVSWPIELGMLVAMKLNPRPLDTQRAGRGTGSVARQQQHGDRAVLIRLCDNHAGLSFSLDRAQSRSMISSCRH